MMARPSSKRSPTAPSSEKAILLSVWLVAVLTTGCARDASWFRPQMHIVLLHEDRYLMLSDQGRSAPPAASQRVLEERAVEFNDRLEWLSDRQDWLAASRPVEQFAADVEAARGRSGELDLFLILPLRPRNPAVLERMQATIKKAGVCSGVATEDLPVPWNAQTRPSMSAPSNVRGGRIIAPKAALSESDWSDAHEDRRFLNVPDAEACKIDDPGSALFGITTMTAVEMADYDTYKRMKAAGELESEGVYGNYVYFAVEVGRDVRFDSLSAWVFVTERYKARLPQAR